MLNLIRLEWKKNNIGKYIRNAAIMTFVLLFFILLMARELDADTSMEAYNGSVVNTTVDLFTHMGYIVFTGVMIASFIVGAYEKKTINLMFSYPIKRQTILMSKVLAVWIFNFVALTLSKILIYAILLCTKSLTNISGSSIQFAMPSFWLNIVISSIAMVSVSFIALLIGLKMKSGKAAIITSVILVCVTQGNVGTYTLVGNAPFYALLFVLAGLSVILSIYNVETKDVM